MMVMGCDGEMQCNGILFVLVSILRLGAILFCFVLFYSVLFNCCSTIHLVLFPSSLYFSHYVHIVRQDGLKRENAKQNLNMMRVRQRDEDSLIVEARVGLIGPVTPHQFVRAKGCGS